MRLRDVKYAVPHIRKTLLLNENMGELKLASLEGGTIIIDSVRDKLIKCRFNNCKIISEVPLTIDRCVIDDFLEAPENTGRIDKSIPHAYIDSCYFNLCHMPKADYGNNYIMGKPQSSGEKTNESD